MFKIKLIGEIGWDIYTFMVDEKLKEAAGKDLDIYISSPGGSLFEGVEIFQAFSQYKKDFPDAQMILNMGALVASMGSYNAANKVFDIVTVQQNTSWMDHNPLMGVYGDFQEMKKGADFLERLAAMMAVVYSKKSGQSIEDTRNEMNSETWLFGQEIIDAGYADELLPDIPKDEPKDRASAIAHAELKFKAVMKKVKETEVKESDFEKVAAILKDDKQNPPQGGSGVPQKPSNTPADGGNNNQEDIIMNYDELKSKHPEIHAEAIEAGKDQGIKSEQERTKSLLEMKKRKDFEGIESIHDRIDEGIANGESMQTVELGIMALLKKDSVLAAIDTNGIGDIVTGKDGQTVSGESSLEIEDESGKF